MLILSQDLFFAKIIPNLNLIFLISTIFTSNTFKPFPLFKNTAFLCLCAVFIACDDGDLQIETLDFDSVDPQTCETLVADGDEALVFFKINGDEALILELPASAIKNEVSSDVESEVTAGGSTAVTYRIFDDDVTQDYFCSQVPLGTPLLTEEIQAQAGKVIITTTMLDSLTFSHEIRLSEITLITGTNTRITDLSINSFGVINTTQTSE